MTQNKSTQKSSERQFTGRDMIIVMVSFFGVILIANLSMLYFATTSWTGLVVKNGYIASQNFNKDQATQAALERQGWTGNLDIKAGHFSFHLTKLKQNVDGCAISGLLQRPAHNRSDSKLDFQSVKPGHYQAFQALEPGQWVLALKAQCPETTGVFTQRYRFMISPAKS